MRRLLLLRHAKSSWDEASLPDHARPLNARGRQAAAAMASTMVSLGLLPDHVLVSTARRTQETWAALEALAPHATVVRSDELYLATADQLLDSIRAVPAGVTTLLVVGHNPGLHELALSLAGPVGMMHGGDSANALAAGYPTATLTEFEVIAPWWDLAAGRARMIRFLSPKDLPETAV